MEQNNVTAEFESYNGYVIIQWSLIVVFFICVFIVCFKQEQDLIFALAIIIGGITLLGSMIMAVFKKGSITVNDDGIRIVYLLFNVPVKVKDIQYKEVACAMTEIETQGQRYGDVLYNIIFYLTLKDESQIKLKARLDVSYDLPVKEPAKFKKKSENAPLAVVAKFIERKRLNN